MLSKMVLSNLFITLVGVSLLLMGVDDDFKGLCTVPRSPVGAVRQEALIDLMIFISSDWRSMGVTPRLDTWIAPEVHNVPTMR